MKNYKDACNLLSNYILQEIWELEDKIKTLRNLLIKVNRMICNQTEEE